MEGGDAGVGEEGEMKAVFNKLSSRAKVREVTD